MQINADRSGSSGLGKSKSSKIPENFVCKNRIVSVPLRSTLVFFSIVNENRPAKQVRTVTVHEPTFNEQGA
jgi:hypothetical protein